MTGPPEPAFPPGDGAVETILWRRLDRPGHEHAVLSRDSAAWRLAGVAVFQHEKLACRLDYSVLCDAAWRTRSGRVTGWVGQRAVDVEVSADGSGLWHFNGVECPDVAESLDLDLNFSPSTNLLPIRRLDLSVGEQAQFRAAWLRFPGFTLEPLEQVYRRTSELTYRYESAGGRFTAQLAVNRAGFVTSYPNVWLAE